MKHVLRLAPATFILTITLVSCLEQTANQPRISDMETGGIEILRVDYGTGKLVPLLSLIEDARQDVHRNTYLNLYVEGAYFSALSSPGERSEWELALRAQINDKIYNHLQGGATQAASVLNFRGIPILEHFPWTGNSIGISMDIVKVHEKERKRLKEVLDGFKASGIGSLIPPPISLAFGSLDVSRAIKTIIDDLKADEDNQFPFAISLHEAHHGDHILSSPLYNGNYIFVQHVQNGKWTRNKITQELRLDNGTLYDRENAEFRERSYIVLTAESRRLRPSYSSLQYTSSFAQANQHKRSYQFGAAADAVAKAINTLLTHDSMYLTQTDIDLRSKYLSTHHHIFKVFEANQEYDFYSRQRSGSMGAQKAMSRSGEHMVDALLAWKGIGNLATGADDITPARLEDIGQYICSPQVKVYVPKTHQGLRTEICETSVRAVNYESHYMLGSSSGAMSGTITPVKLSDPPIRCPGDPRCWKLPLPPDL